LPQIVLSRLINSKIVERFSGHNFYTAILNVVENAGITDLLLH